MAVMELVDSVIDFLGPQALGRDDSAVPSFLPWSNTSATFPRCLNGLSALVQLARYQPDGGQVFLFSSWWANDLMPRSRKDTIRRELIPAGPSRSRSIYLFRLFAPAAHEAYKPTELWLVKEGGK